MKIKLFLLDETVKEVEFSDCKTLEDVCKWFNQAAPFITISNDIIINSSQIRRIKPLVKISNS